MEKNASHTPNDQPVQAELVSFMESERIRLEKLRTDLASLALSDATRADALAAADSLVQSAMGVREAIVESDTDDNEIFGDEESYWTVYRMFASAANQGRLWSLDEIWEHLAKSYDMSGETYQTVEETLEEWRSDIEQDALDRTGVNGAFMRHEDSYVFAEFQSKSTPTVPVEVVRPPRVQKNDTRRAAIEKTTPLQDLGERIKTILKDSTDGTVKQSQVKKALAADGIPVAVTQEQLQETIDALVGGGCFYKFQRGGVAHLSLTPRDNEVRGVRQGKSEKDSNGEEPLDIPLSVDILRALCAPGAHYQQKLTLNELWRKIYDVDDKSQAIPDSEIEQLKRTCNYLRAIDIVTAGGEKRGTSGTKTRTATSSKRRRSGNTHVYKVGLASQQVKKELQDVLHTHSAEKYIQEKMGLNG
jgi:hypothetical protein